MNYNYQLVKAPLMDRRECRRSDLHSASTTIVISAAYSCVTDTKYFNY